MRTVRGRCTPIRTTAVTGLFLLAASALGRGQELPQPSRSLKILYAGHPGTEREKDFVAFLKKHFDVVQTGNLKTFTEVDAEGFDVTLLDWDWNAFEEPGPKISESFSRPVVALGTAGALMCRNWRLKTVHW
jgi:hypothetical protein